MFYPHGMHFCKWSTQRGETLRVLPPLTPTHNLLTFSGSPGVYAESLGYCLLFNFFKSALTHVRVFAPTRMHTHASMYMDTVAEGHRRCSIFLKLEISWL